MKKQRNPEPPIEDIKMVDWYAAFILMRLSSLDNDRDWTASEVFDRAEAMMEERARRIERYASPE